MSRKDLQKAIWTRDLAELRRLIAAGADISEADDTGRSLLMDAVNAHIEPSASVVEFLLQHGADPNVIEKQYGYSALSFASQHQNPEFVRILIKHGAKVESRDLRGATPLLIAVMSFRGDTATVSELLAAGADPDMPCGSDSPRKHAAYVGKLAIVRLFEGTSGRA